jgi:hypothetical protein
VPREFAVLADGSVIASYRATASGPEDLVHLKVSGGQCSPTLNYTSLPAASGGVATDFAVSPDGTQVAYLLDSAADAGPWAVDDAGSQLPGGNVYVVPVAGGTPKQASTAPALFGPRWIGGGAWLVFTRLDGVTGSGAVGGGGGMVASSVVIVPMGGGGISSIVAKGDGVTSFVSTSGSGACSTALGAPGGAGATGAAGLISLVAFAGLLRARRSPGRASKRERT